MQAFEGLLEHTHQPERLSILCWPKETHALRATGIAGRMGRINCWGDRLRLSGKAALWTPDLEPSGRISVSKLAEHYSRHVACGKRWLVRAVFRTESARDRRVTDSSPHPLLPLCRVSLANLTTSLESRGKLLKL